MTPRSMSFGTFLTRSLTLLAAVALAIMVFWTIADVVLRAILKWPLHGSVAIVETALVLVALLALADCLARDEQIKVDVFDHMISPRALFSLKLLGDISMLVFVLLLAMTMVQPIVDAWRFWDIKPDIPVPIFALLGVIEVSLIVSVFVLVGKIVRSLRVRAGILAPSGDEP